MTVLVLTMGTTEATEASTVPTALANALFTPVQQRVLGLLFGQPERRFQSVALIRLAGAGTGATHRLLQQLAASGLVRASMEDWQKYYQANPESPVFEELVRLIRKTVGLAGPLREALAAPSVTRLRRPSSTAQWRAARTVRTVISI